MTCCRALVRCVQIKRLFELLDTDENGSLEFREFLTGLSIINEEVGMCLSLLLTIPTAIQVIR